MFGKYEFKAGFVKKDRTPASTYDAPIRNTPEDNIRLVRNVVKDVVIGAVAVFATVVVLNTASEIAVNRYGQSQKELEN